MRAVRVVFCTARRLALFAYECVALMKKKWDTEPRYGWHRFWSWVSFRAFIIANVCNPEATQTLKKRGVPRGVDEIVPLGPDPSVDEKTVTAYRDGVPVARWTEGDLR